VISTGYNDELDACAYDKSIKDIDDGIVKASGSENTLRAYLGIPKTPGRNRVDKNATPFMNEQKTKRQRTTHARYERFNRCLQELASSRPRVVYVNTNELINQEHTAHDGTHLNPEAYALLLKNITDLLGEITNTDFLE
jgi:lysophospholipase L1-like esterase